MNETTMAELLAEIHLLTERLATFENKYGLLTDVFYEWYSAGNEPEDDAWVMDFTEWAGVYQSLQLLTAEYHTLLKELPYGRNAINRHIQSYVQATLA